MYVLELGGQDDRFAAAEARNAAVDVDVVAPGLATATAIEPDRVRGLAYTHRASEVVGRTDASAGSARVLLEAASLDRDRTETVAVRARNVREAADVDTQAVERSLGGILVDRGFAVDLDDPDHELRAIFSNDICVVGWLTVESVRDYGDRMPSKRPFFQPGSMDPLDARALANLAGAGPGTTVLDPMCGTGGVLLEAGLLGGAVVGVDAQWKMVRGSGENLASVLPPDSVLGTVWGDATRLPLCDDTVDTVIFDAPYGRQSKIAGRGLDDLVGGALAEARRVAQRAVVVGDRDWASAAREAGWSVEDSFERPVHRSLTRYVFVLDGT